ncbi:hypothetical protein ZTR_08022 [Talaromyces verruculosus]|nr:hypothetical protein ZTR_08022 [Talaromyces verruculosus]
MDHTTKRREAILRCVNSIRDGLRFPFILLGGAAVLSLRSRRITEDVDIMVPSDASVEAISAVLQRIEGFQIIDGKLCFASNDRKSVVKIDILTSTVREATYEDMRLNTTTLNGLRAEDRNGIKKRDTDAADIVFIGQRMLELGQQISDACAERFRVGYYHMLYVRQSIGDDSDINRLIAVGLRKLLIPWAENTKDQRGFYRCYAGEGTDPLTVSLENEYDDQPEEL